MRARTRVIKREHGGGMVSTSRCKELSYNERERVTEGEWELQCREEEESENTRIKRDKKGLSVKIPFLYIKKSNNIGNQC